MNSSQMRSVGKSAVIVAVGGVDPGAGAGLGRDLLTVTSLGAGVRMVGTAWTEQGAAGVRSIEARSPAAIEDALHWALREPAPGAVKVGMVAGPDQAAAILRGLAAYPGPVVVDPVLAASNGGALWSGPLDALMTLLRRASLATPNAREAAVLAGRAVDTVADAATVAADLRRAGMTAVLVKGGHLQGGPGGGAREGGGGVVTDVLASANGERRYTRPRAPGPTPRGTGCALASAIAVGLARDLSLEDAVAEATSWLGDRIHAAVVVDGEKRLGR